MYLTCKNCNTSFVIDHDLLAPNGKKVKCSKCSYVWYQDYIKADVVASSAQSAKLEKQQHIDQPTNKLDNIIMRPGFASYHLPVVIKNNNSSFLFYTLSLCIIFVMLYVVFLYCTYLFIGSVKSANDALDVAFVGALEDRFENKIFLKYQISNTSDVTKTLPITCVTFFDDFGNQISSSTINTQDVILESQHYIYITSEFSGFSNQAHSFAITFKYNF